MLRAASQLFYIGDSGGTGSPDDRCQVIMIINYIFLAWRGEVPADLRQGVGERRYNP